VKEDTYATACRINYLIAKIRPNDVNKISVAEELIEKYVDVDRILSLIETGAGPMFHVN
jgi:BioD-like phosphotransacetylase family protein